jgi:hypothetical protein
MQSCSIKTLLLAFALVLLAAPIAHSGEEKEGEKPANETRTPVSGVVVELSRSMYAPGEDAQITVTNGRKDSIFLAGCGGFQVELFESESYTPVAGEHCVSEGEAIEVPPGTHMISYTPKPERSGSILRIAVPFGWGCNAGRELSQARCADFATAVSGSFRVSRKAKK